MPRLKKQKSQLPDYTWSDATLDLKVHLYSNVGGDQVLILYRWSDYTTLLAERRPWRPLPSWVAMGDSLMAFLKKPDALQKLGVPAFGKAMGESVAKTPALVEYLTMSQYDDGSPRKESKMTLMIEDSAWKMCLNDVDNGRSLWVTGVSLQACLMAMEAKLLAPDADWRTWKDFKQGAARGGTQKK